MNGLDGKLCRMCIVTTVPMPMRMFMGPHIRELSKRYDITLVTNGDSSELTSLLSPRVHLEPFPIQRKISIIKDMLCLWALFRLFRRERFNVVQSNTPKAGLLAMVAAAFAGVPIRTHGFTGQVWATKLGLGRWFLKIMDRIIVACATDVFADSFSQREFMVSEGIVGLGQAIVFRQGSVCGVDSSRFSPNPMARRKIRNGIGIPESAVVAIYLGRLNADKGVPELAMAYKLAAAQCSDLHMLFVGPDEAGMRSLVTTLLADFSDRIHFVGYTTESEVFMASADFFVLASHREGFGSTVIEAAACEIPSIGTRIYGLTDAIIDGCTGILVPAYDPTGLAAAMVALTKDRSLRLGMGKKARERVERDFKQEHLTAALVDFYDGRVKQACRHI